MSQSRTSVLRLESFAGGLNDADPPQRIGDDQLLVASNVELTSSGSVRARPGVRRLFPAPSGTASIGVLHRHTPSQALSATEVWALPSSASNMFRSVSGTTWSNVSVGADTGSSTPPTDAVSFNGKLYVAYEKNAGTDRLHCWDGSQFRKVGISTPSAPSVANTGAGSYAATVRYYKVQFLLEGPSNKFTFSDLSAATTFTPSGTGTHARITKPATPDSATAWRLWASSDNISYYLIQDDLVSVTTMDDNAAPSTYATTNLGASFVAAESGAYTPPWSAKYLLVDENRLLIAGAFENTRYASRIGWSSILGTSAAAYGETSVVNDDERFPTDQYLDLDSDEGGEITGMETLNGSVYVFKRYAIYKLVRTGNAAAAYRPVTVTKTVGAISRKSIVPGEDESGNPCLYFLSERGAHRLGGAGLQYLSGDIETLWGGVNIKPATAAAHGVYDPRRSQVRWWVPAGSTELAPTEWPTTQIVFHIRLGRPTQAGRVSGGWTIATGNNQVVAASAMLPSSTSLRDYPLIPAAVRVTTGGLYPVVWSYVNTYSYDDVVAAGASTVTANTNPTTEFQTKYFALTAGGKGGVRDVYVTLKPVYPTGAVVVDDLTLSATLARDFGAESRTETEAWAGSSRTPKQIPDLTMAQAQYISLSLSSASGKDFVIDDVALRVSREEPV